MNMHLMAPIGGTGYGYVGLNILKELDSNHDIGLSLIGHPNVENQDQAKFVQRAMETTHLSLIHI